MAWVLCPSEEELPKSGPWGRRGGHAVVGKTRSHTLKWLVISSCSHRHLGRWHYCPQFIEEETDKHLCALARVSLCHEEAVVSLSPLPRSCSLCFTCTCFLSVSILSLSSTWPLPLLQSPLFDQILWFADCWGLFQRTLQKWIFKAHRFQYFGLRWSPHTWRPWRAESGGRRAYEPACPFLQWEGHVVIGIQVDMGPKHCFVSVVWGEKLSFC